MSKKRLFAMLMAGAMALTMTACGSKPADTGSAADGGDDATNGGAHKIALIAQHQTNAFQIAIAEAAEAKAKELGVELTVLSADQDAATQISQIEQCVSEGYEAILFEPVDPEGLRDAAKSAADSGVVMINIVSACNDWENSGIAAVSYGNNVKAGETEMQQVADLLGGKGNIAILTGPSGDAGGLQRMEGYENVLKNYVKAGETEMQQVADLLGGKGNIAILTGPSGDAGGLQRMEGYENVLKNYPDIKQVVAPADCKWDTAQAQATVESWLSAYDLDAIVCQNDGMAVGAGNAAGANSGIIIAGVDGTPDGFEAIKDGRITGTVSQNGADMAANGIEAAVTLLDGGKLETTEIITDNTWIDVNNLADYE